jgi:hypothetical protein
MFGRWGDNHIDDVQKLACGNVCLHLAERSQVNLLYTLRLRIRRSPAGAA